MASMSSPVLSMVLTSLLILFLGPLSGHAQEKYANIELEELLDLFAHEPTVSDVQAAALRYGELGGYPMDRFSRRARLSNLLPRVQGQWGWLDQRDSQLRYRENLKTDDDGLMYRDVAQNNLNEDLRLRSLYSLRVSIDLGGLLYDRSEPVIAREVRSRLIHREELLQRVTLLYFERRHRQFLTAAEPHLDWRAKLERRVEVETLTAQIDALTGGWYRSALRASEAQRSKP